MPFKNLLVLLSLCVAVCSQAAESSKMVEFKIAGGQVVKCPATDAGPLPAESGPYKMEVAAFMTGQDESKQHTFLIFTFGISVQKKGKPTHIRVEDVSDESAVTLVDDKSPKIEKKYWRGDAAPLMVQESSTPWVFDGKPTIRVFRVTISAKDGPDVVLYQPAWYSAQAKSQIARLVKKNG